MEIAPKNDYVRKHHVTKTKTELHMSIKLPHQNHSLPFIHKKETILSATRIRSRSPMADDTTAFLDELK